MKRTLVLCLITLTSSLPAALPLSAAFAEPTTTLASPVALEEEQYRWAARDILLSAATRLEMDGLSRLADQAETLASDIAGGLDWKTAGKRGRGLRIVANQQGAGADSLYFIDDALRVIREAIGAGY